MPSFWSFPFLFRIPAKHVCEAKAAFPWEWIAYSPKTEERQCPLVSQGWAVPVDPRGSNASRILHQTQLMFSVLWRAALSSVIVAIITQMICCTVTSSQRCHLKLKIHVKSGDATFKQTVETWSDFTINVLLNPFMPLGLRVGDGRFQGPGHLEDVCVNLLRLLMQNTTGWQLIEQILFSHNSGG